MANSSLTPPKKKIGDIKAYTLIAVAAVCDMFKILLFFFNVVPIVGTALDAVVSFFISVIELLIDFGALGWSGVFSGEGGMTNLLITLAVSAVDLTPVIDDLPLTTPAVAFIIWRSRAAYKKEYAEYLRAVAAAGRQEDEEYEVRIRVARAAAERAAAMRQQAMDTSVAAATIVRRANDNEEVYGQAA